MKAFKKYVAIPALIAVLMVSPFAPSISAAPIIKSADVEKDYSKIYEGLGLEVPEEVKASKKDEQEAKYSEDTFVIELDQALSPAEHRRLGGMVTKRIGELGYEVIQVRGDQPLEDVMRAYAQTAGVKSVSPSAVIQKFGQDPKAENMYHLDALNVEKAQALAGDHDVKVAIIDGGVDYDHPELKNKVIADYNVQEPMRRGLKDSHGTHVAGLVAAEKGNGVGGYGINPDAEIVSIDVFNGGWGTSDFAIAEAIMVAIEHEVDVINLSLGGPGTPIMEEAVNEALKAGITIVAAAGNDASDYVSYPAGYAGVISVGASDEQNELAWFSTYGSSIDVVAPGDNIYSSDYLPYKGSTYSAYPGTSFASPIVAGVVSLLLTKHPDLTPVEVMYILHQTAEDLGERGFDQTFGYGLIDPVAVLNYNVNQIPSLGSLEQDPTELAVPLALDEDGFEATGEITYPGETHWWSTDVQEGELVQLVLDGTEPYDYKAVLHYYEEGDSEPTETIKVNDVMAGETEGYLFKADADGKVVIGVKDAYNKYHENGESNYSVSFSTYSQYLDEGNSEEHPTIISQIPYSTENPAEGPYYLAGEEGDSDFFRFSVDEAQVIEVNMSGIPGVNPILNAYFAEDFDQEIPEELLEELPEEILEEIMAQEPWPFTSSDMNAIGKGEVLSFEAMPGQEYVIEVTNQSNMMFDPFILMLDPSFFEMFEARSSHIPYELSIRGEVLPEDEDGFPMNGISESPSETVEEELIDVPEMPEDMASYLQKRQANKQLIEIIMGGGMGYYSDVNAGELIEMATPYEIGSDLTGYFQYDYDIDLLKIEPITEAIFQFEWEDKGSLSPVIEVYKYDEEEDYLQFVTDTYGWGFFGPVSSEPGLTIGLEAGETYLFQLSNRSYQPALDAYEITSEIVVENPSDAYENNNLPENATELPDYSFNANFALTGDSDIYYMEAEEDGIYGFNLEVLHDKRHQLRGMQQELYTPIDPIVLIVEDKEGNREIAPDSSMYMFDRGWDNEGEYGSFKVKEGTGYFIIIENWMNTPSLTPYRMTVDKAHEAGEEETGTIAERAEKMTKTAEGRWHASDFLTLGAKGGDVNYYSFKLDQEADVQITFDVPHDIDGELTIYNQDGNKIEQSSTYSQGDAEVIVTTLAKGMYYIGVKDVEGNPSIHAYDVNVAVID